MKRKILTLCLIRRDGKILLGLKKRGFGMGRWNGFGGKLSIGETIEAAARRELKEESGLNSLGEEKRGILNFEFENNPEVLEVHIFAVNDYSGIPEESEEMKPQWFDISEIPYANMWPDDRHWLPLFLSGKKFTGNFYFKDMNILLRHELNEVTQV